MEKKMARAGAFDGSLKLIMHENYSVIQGGICGNPEDGDAMHWRNHATTPLTNSPSIPTSASDVSRVHSPTHTTLRCYAVVVAQIRNHTSDPEHRPQDY